MNGLKRFLEPQERDYATALAEMQTGRKHSHWIWYIFPQLKGLGFSHQSEFYGIADLREAEAYLKHPILGKRLTEISNTILNLPGDEPAGLMGYPDNLKLKSCMTLFSLVPEADPVFGQVLAKYFNGQPDKQTLQLLNR